MNEKTKKRVICKILESWYAIDSILLNGHAREVIKEGKVFKEYNALKASILSNLFEYYQLVKYTPSNKSIPSDTNVLIKEAVNSAKNSKTLSAKLIRKESVKKKLKNIVMTEASKYGIENINKFGDKIIQEKFLELSLDNLLIGSAVLESKNTNKNCDTNCKILESAHRTMRSTLVRLALNAKKFKCSNG